MAPAPWCTGSALTARGSELRGLVPHPRAGEGPSKVTVNTVSGMWARGEGHGGAPTVQETPALGQRTSGHGPAAHDVTRRESG